jgi:ABC-type phosphate transport system substrate-binding protein
MSKRSLSKALAIVLLCAGACSCFAAPVARADIYVVVHSENTQRLFSRQEVADLFMGRKRNFSNGDTALVLDLPRDNAVRRVFYSTLTGMSPAQLGSYWAELAASGQTMPPQVLSDEAEVARVIRRNPNAVGYLSLGTEPADKGLRIVFVLKAAP